MNGNSLRMNFGSSSAVKIIVIINVVIYFIKFVYGLILLGAVQGTDSNTAYLIAQATASRDIFTLFGIMPLGYGFWPWQPLTSIFLHGDFWHLLFNMLSLWFIGSALERHFGTKRFWFFYLFCGILAALSASLIGTIEMSAGFATAPAPTIGASGAIFAVLIALAYFFPNNVVYLNFLIPIRIKWLVAILIGINIYFWMQGTNVSVSSHLMGALIGFIYLMIRYPIYPQLEKIGHPLRQFTDKYIVPLWDQVVSLFIKTHTAPKRVSKPKFKVFTNKDREKITTIKKNNKGQNQLSPEELLDMLLEKISKYGIDSLTPAEKEFLDKFSKGHNDYKGN